MEKKFADRGFVSRKYKNIQKLDTKKTNNPIKR